MGFGGRLSRRIARLTILIPVTVAFAAFAAMGASAPSAEALDSDEVAILDTINSYRAQSGLGPLSLDQRLNDIARWMADDMANNNYFSHTDSQGRDPFTRMDQLGYALNTWRGENLVAGTETSAAAFDMWRTSEGHNANMLGANYTVVGIARAYNPGSTFGWYWATEFGGQALSVQPPVQPTPEPAPYIPPPPPPTVAPQPVVPVISTPLVTDAPPPAPTSQVTPEPVPSNDPWWHVRPIEIVWQSPTDSNGGWLSDFFGALRSLESRMSGNVVSDVH